MVLIEGEIKRHSSGKNVGGRSSRNEIGGVSISMSAIPFSNLMQAMSTFLLSSLVSVVCGLWSVVG